MLLIITGLSAEHCKVITGPIVNLSLTHSQTQLVTKGHRQLEVTKSLKAEKCNKTGECITHNFRQSRATLAKPHGEKRAYNTRMQHSPQQITSAISSFSLNLSLIKMKLAGK